MDVSAIIPVYNRRKFLGRALDSVYAQSLPVDEVIVVDDGSTDDIRGFLDSRFPEVRYIYQDHLGVSAARNRGIRDASNPWLVFLDSDDEWMPKKLEVQVAAIEEGDYLVSHTDEIWIRRGVRVNPMKKHRKRGGDIYRHCLPLCVISPSSVLMHREVFDVIGDFDEDLPACEDYDLWLRMCARFTVGFVAEPLVIKHGGHEDQLSRAHWGMDRFRVRALEKMLLSELLDEAEYELTRQAMVSKLQILNTGAIKHGNLELREFCNQKISTWALSADGAT